MHFPCWFAKLLISFVVPKAFSHQKEEADCFLDVLSMGNGYTFCYNFFKFGVTLADIIRISPSSNQIRTLVKRSYGSNHYRNLLWIWKILAFWIRPGKDQYFGNHKIPKYLPTYIFTRDDHNHKWYFSIFLSAI